MRYILIYFGCFFIWQSLTAQIGFTEANHLIHDEKIRSTLSIGVADMNDDYKDDIVFLEQGTDLIVAYQSAPGLPFRMVRSGTILDNPAWALSLGDLDDDGIAEIFACGINTFGNIFRLNPNGTYGFQQLLFGLTFPQNSNMADIDNDGMLDVFVCDERAYNDLYLNDGTGNMVYNDFIDMNTVPPSDNSGNYGSEWVDFDGDRDIDLFITKCKPAIVDPEDPLRVNVLFVNDGNQQYTEQADAFGLNSGAQSWTGSFGDLDNDGDLDCFVSNHDTTHVIYENIDNDTFIDVTGQWMTPFKSSSIQAAIRDFDNNGYMDIYVSGDLDYMIWNSGNRTMTVEKNPLGLLDVFTFATGDLNDDGFLDIVASHGGLNYAGDYDDVVWLNDGNNNRYIKLSFLGEETNRKGVGVKVNLFSELGIQTRDVKIGESYGTTNSGNVHIGLGVLDVVDSIYVYWPSGVIDKHYNLQANQHYLLHEGKCISPFLNIEFDGDNVLCEGDTIELQVPGGFAEYQWSNGQNTPSIALSEEATITFRGVDEYGCVHQSNIEKILFEPDETPIIHIEAGGLINCLGTTVWLTTDEANAYHWSNGAETQSVNVIQPAIYTVTITGKCAEFISDPVFIDFFEVSPPEFSEDTLVIEEPSILTLSALGREVHWFADEVTADPLAVGDFETGLIDRDTVFYAADFDHHIAEIQSVGMKEHQGTPLGGSNLNSGLMFNCFADGMLEQVKVITDIAGYRTIELKQLDEETGEEALINSKRIFAETGSQYLDLDFPLIPGIGYILTTNQDSNLVNLGTKSPMFYRSNAGVSYPYVLEEILEMTTSLHGPSYYYYFFDWKVRPESIACFSDRIPLSIVLDTITTHIPGNHLGLSDWGILPNPSTGSISIHGPLEQVYGMARISIYNGYGQQVLDKLISEDPCIDLHGLTEGVYWVVIREDKRTVLYRGKLMLLKG